MNHKQHPIDSGFAPASTADDILASIDLTGRNVVITGGHAGIGLEVTRALAKAGARILIGARDPERAAEAVKDLPHVQVDKLDLINPRSIDAFATRWLNARQPLHILINNASASGRPERDARGYETQFATNHLGHFQLTLALLPALRAARNARVVNVSSGAHRFGRIRWDDPNFKRDFNSLAAGQRMEFAGTQFIQALSPVLNSTALPATIRYAVWV
jgi:NAD(P)-dependent dehydrogenase (short-subunit alcohol dehydrogenase family)